MIKIIRLTQPLLINCHATVVLLSITVAFSAGYIASVISGDSLTALQKELLVSIMVGGAAIGAALGGPINEVNVLGRKLTIIISSALYCVSAPVMAGAPINSLG